MNCSLLATGVSVERTCTLRVGGGQFRAQRHGGRQSKSSEGNRSCRRHARPRRGQLKIAGVVPERRVAEESEVGSLRSDHIQKKTSNCGWPGDHGTAAKVVQ